MQIYQSGIFGCEAPHRPKRRSKGYVCPLSVMKETLCCFVSIINVINVHIVNIIFYKHIDYKHISVMYKCKFLFKMSNQKSLLNK